MKVLVGVCGIGNGHLNRQSCVVENCLKCGYDVAVATTNENIQYFQLKFPNIEIINIDIPWITCNSIGIDFKDCLRRYISKNVDQYKTFLEFAIKVEKVFNGIPNVVITDYEPNVAQYSYAVGIPLICMEQQSKFLYLKEDIIADYSIKEEIKRINYFFPKFDKKIISSFFPIDIENENVKVVSPIIRQMEERIVKNKHVLVYFSPYSDSYKYKLVLEAISKIKYLDFIVYTKQDFTQFSSNNISFKKYGETFKGDLESSLLLISTAGHQLLSEAISINVPMYLIPLDTYEQNYNALMIKKYKLGEVGYKINSEEIENVYSNLDHYIQNIDEFKNKYYKNDWTKILNETLEEYKKHLK